MFLIFPEFIVFYFSVQVKSWYFDFVSECHFMYMQHIHVSYYGTTENNRNYKQK